MSVYRFRVKHEYNPTSLWRDIEIGEDKTLSKFQSKINRSMGLNQGHLWFFGTGQNYWDTNVQYVSSYEFKEQEEQGLFKKDMRKASKTSIKELDLEERDRICYLFDYGDEWRFYAILKEIKEGSSEKEPEVVKKKGEKVEQYAGAPTW